MASTLEIRPSDSLLVFAPHPDDETLACGGLLQRAHAAGAGVRVAFVTDGENNPWPQRALEHRWRIGAADRARFGARRRGEARRALERLGLDAEVAAVHLGLPDQGLTALVLTDLERLLDALRREILAQRPTLVAGPSPRDRHPDHSALGLALELARRSAWLAGRPTVRVVRYLVHGRSPARPDGPPILFRLTREERLRKRDAMLAYRSQMIFRRLFFLSFAGAAEEFAIGGGAPPVEGRRNPDAAAREGIEVDTGSRSLWRAAQPSELLLVAVSNSGRSEGWRISLRGRARRLDIRSARDGTTVARATRGDRTISLPPAVVGDATSLFAKVEHRWSFFDEDGWRELSPPAASASAIVRAAPPALAADENRAAANELSTRRAAARPQRPART